jgi:hypothetical protein
MFKSSANVDLNMIAAAGIVDDTHWCVGVQNLKGDKQFYKYSARGGLEQGVCGAADIA